MSRVTSNRSIRNRAVLSPDCLEDRTVPSGNVTASVRGGVLHIDGDALSNEIWVTTGRGLGEAYVTPLGGTTVNGGASPVLLSGITAGARHPPRRPGPTSSG